MIGLALQIGEYCETVKDDCLYSAWSLEEGVAYGIKFHCVTSLW